MLVVFDEEMVRILLPRTRSAENRIGLTCGVGDLTTLFKLVGHFVCRRIICDVLHIAAPLENQRLESFLCQLLGRPATADSRADDNGIVTSLLNAVYIRVGHQISPSSLLAG